MENKYAQPKLDSFSQIVESSKRRPNLLKTDDGKEYVYKIFNEFLNNHNIERYSRNTALGAVFAEKINRTLRSLKKGLFSRKEMPMG